MYQNYLYAFAFLYKQKSDFRSHVLVLILLLFGMPLQNIAGEKVVSFFKVADTNAIEHNPHFLPGSKNVLYMVFKGDLSDPLPWDNRLVLYNRKDNSHQIIMTNVVDFKIAQEQQLFDVLTAEPLTMTDDSDMLRCRVVKLNPVTLEQSLVATEIRSLDTQLDDMLNPGTSSDMYSGQHSYDSPFSDQSIDIVLHEGTGLYYYDFICSDAPGQVLLTSQVFPTCADYRWQPPLVWLDASTFITMVFNDNNNLYYSHHDGMFAIVKVDINKNNTDYLFVAREIKAFPEFCLNSSRSVLYFLKQQNATTELCRLDIQQKTMLPLYSTSGDMAQVRFSDNGKNIIFSNIIDSDIDVVRLDLEPAEIPFSIINDQYNFVMDVEVK